VEAAHRLVGRGDARLDRSAQQFFANPALPDREEISRAFSGACHGGQQQCATYVLDRGADVNWMPGWENSTPLDAAIRSGATDLTGWLRIRGATTTDQTGQ
jgi:hypothetical protein